MTASTQYTGVNWALTSVSIALTGGRFAIRGYHSRRLFWDDLVHLFALLILIAHGVTNHVTNDAKMQLALAATTKGGEAKLLEMYHHVRYLNTVNNCLLYLVFWAVKLSFLLFYRLLFETSIPFTRAWWAVLAFTLLTFWAPIAGVLATCAHVKTVPEFKACNAANHARAVKLEYSCVINVVSDLAIMALPLWMLKDLKVQSFQKIGLAFIFSLAIVCVVLDIVRTVEALASNQVLYTILEINFVVIISCLPSYRAIVSIAQKRKLSKSLQYSSGSRPSIHSSWRRPSYLSSWKRMGSKGQMGNEGDDHMLRHDVENGINTGLNNIRVTKHFTVSEAERDPYALSPLEIPDHLPTMPALLPHV